MDRRVAWAEGLGAPGWELDKCRTRKRFESAIRIWVGEIRSLQLFPRALTRYPAWLFFEVKKEIPVETSALRIWAWSAVVLVLLARAISAQNPPQNPPGPPAQQQPSSGQPQAPASGEGGADSNPLEVVLLQLRNEYYNLNNGNWADVLVLRSDRAFLKKRKWAHRVGILTRFDFPIVTAHIGSSTHAGLGDLYGQFAYVPFLTPRFALFAGSGASIPTATYRTLGTGKWSIAPLGGPAYFFGRRRGFAFIRFQEYISFAGNSNRPDVNYVQVTPTVMWRFNRKNWLLAQEESHTDLASSQGTWYKAGVQVGHMFNRKVGAWVMPEVLWGEPRPGNFNLKFSLVWNR